MPDGIMVDAANKAIVLSDRFDESKAQFTFGNGESVADYAWKKYSTAEIMIDYELPSEEYWFEGSSMEESPLNEIVSTEAALDLSTDIGADRFKQSLKDLTLGSARRHQK